jgi:outer membrane protein, adhesin transport system
VQILSRCFPLCLIGLFACVVVLPTQAAMPEPLRQAIVEAVNTNPEVQMRWHAFLAAEEGQGVARGRYYPEVDLNLSAARQWQDSDAGRFDRDPLSATLTLNQMLYDGFFTRSDVRRLGHARLVRYYELLEAAEQAALEAVRAYADVERYRELVLLAEENYRAHQVLYEQVQELARTGVGRGVDLEQATGRLALAESNLLTEVANLHDVTARFLRVVGRMPAEDFVDLIGVLPDGELPETAYAAQVEALATNPALFAAVENILSAQQQVSVGRSHYHPRLDFQVRQSRDNALGSLFQEGGEVWVNDTVAGVVLRLNLFRGFADQARIGQFVEESNVAKDELEIVCRNVRQEVTIAFHDVRVLDDRLRYLDQHQLSSDRVRTAYRQQFGIGQRSLLDLLDSENEYFVARREYVEGQFDREIALARTYTGLGRLLPVLEIARDTMPEIREVTTIDPEQICPPVRLPVVQREPVQPAPLPEFTTHDRLSAATSFGFDSATLTPEGREALRVLAGKLVTADSAYSAVLVEGHTCSLGPEEYNLDLSERRARSVAEHLVSLGVRSEAIRVVGHGEGRPVADNATREGRDLNRRVEISTDLRSRGDS